MMRKKIIKASLSKSGTLMNKKDITKRLSKITGHQILDINELLSESLTQKSKIKAHFIFVMFNLFTVSALIPCVLFQVLLRGGSIYRDMLKEEEARREEGHVFDVEVRYNNIIKQK